MRRQPRIVKSKAGRRADLGNTFFRSSWEANYARFLNLMIKFGTVEWWQYEPETFWFPGIKRGTVSYLPDFRVKWKADTAPVIAEVKGWMDPQSKTKIKRFRRHFPHHRLEVIDAKAYRALQRQFARSIPEWE